MAIVSHNNFKVIHITSAKTGGAGRAAFRIHNALQENGADSKFFAINDHLKDLDTPIRKKDFLTQKIQWRLRHHFNIELDTRRQIENDLAALPPLDCEIASIPISPYSLKELLNRSKPDIIHLHWVALYFDYIDFFRDCQVPIVWTLHDMNPFSGLFHYENDSKRNFTVSHKLDALVRRVKKKSIQNFKKKLSIVSLSTWLAGKVELSQVFRNRSIRVIPNPIDLDLFSTTDKTGLREKYGIPKNEKVLIALADHTQNFRKGFDLLKDAINKLPEYKLLLVGGKEKDTRDKDNIRYLGRIENDKILSEYYSLADATVIPSREDNLPNVMLESFACGTPVISFNVGGLAEHVKNFETGLIAEEMNAESLRNTIQLFFDNKERFDSAKIRKYAEEHFNEKLIAEKYMEVYSEVLR